MAKKNDTRLSLTIEDIYRLQGRVGRTPIDRLTWAVDFAQLDLQDQTPGDWMNVAQQLWAFSATRVWWEGTDTFRLSTKALRGASKHYENIDAILPTRAKTQGYQNKMRDVLDDLDQYTYANYGPIKKTLHATLYPRGKSASPHLPVFYAIFGTARELRKGPNLIERFFDLLAEVRGFLARCADKKCGRWFVSARFEQKFCSNKCQNRAKSRTTMAKKRDAARRKK